jgi:hypothetical protein
MPQIRHNVLLNKISRAYPLLIRSLSVIGGGVLVGLLVLLK